MLVQLWFALSAVLLQTLMFCFMGHCWVQGCRLTSWLQNSYFHFPALLVAPSFLSTVCCCPVLPLGTLGSSPWRTSASKEQELSVGRGVWSLRLGESWGPGGCLALNVRWRGSWWAGWLLGARWGDGGSFPYTLFPEFFLPSPPLPFPSFLPFGIMHFFSLALRGPLSR